MMSLEQIAMLAISSVVGIASYYFKKNSDRLDKADEQLNTKIESVEKELSEYKLEAERSFVSKDEFIRSISNIDKKLDKIYDEVMKSSSCTKGASI